MRNLERLQEITKAISEETDDERLLRLIIDQAVDLAEGRRGFLILLKGNSLEIRVARNLADQDIHHPEFSVSHSVAMRVARTGEPLLISNASADLRFRESSSISRLHLLSIICVPLRVQDKVIGSLYVDHPSAVDRFDSLHLEVLGGLSDHAAIALEKARLLSENQDRARALSASKREIERLNWELKKTVAEQARELVEVKQTLEKYRKDRGLKYDYSTIITQSARMGDILRLLDRITESSNPVLITGESGTGKELVARAIHGNGPRAKRSFVSLNCAAVPEPLIESELFGYVRGAFTGADRDKAGVFEAADGGTLFLDEIGDMSLEVQKRLLRVLQSGEFLRLGAKEVRKVDVRIIGATNRNLKEMVKSHLFREDLYYRLAVHLVDLPPLRERREDVPLLVSHFMEKHAALAAPGTARQRITAEAMEALQRYRWGGNVRELENEVRRLLTMTGDKPTVELDDLPDSIRSFRGTDAEAAFAGTLKELVDRFERDQVVRALAACSGNKAAAARLLGMSTRNLFKKIEKFGLD
ncbi:MAG: sigma 54-interacting transcriptional regulator [Planctomycetota bacterium]